MRIFYLSLVFVLIGCGSYMNPTTDVTRPTEQQLQSYQNVWVCEDDQGVTLSCEYDADCCEDFSCVKDPAGGRKAKHCIYDPNAPKE